MHVRMWTRGHPVFGATVSLTLVTATLVRSCVFFFVVLVAFVDIESFLLFVCSCSSVVAAIVMLFLFLCC